MNLGFAQYIYQNFYSTEHSESDIANERCDSFWEKLFCGTVSVAVAVGTTILVGYLLIQLGPVGVWITYAAGSILPDGTVAPTDTSIFVEDVMDGDDPFILGAILGVYLGIKFYSWCCSWFEEEDAQVCEAPDGAYWKETDCGEFQFVIFGPSTYSATIWNNINTDPASATTPVPRLTFTVPSPGMESTIFASGITCIENPGSILEFDWVETLTFTSDHDLFPLAWNSAPPSTFDYTVDEEDYWDNSFKVTLNTPSSNAFEYSWAVNSPHEIVEGGGDHENWAEIWVATQNTDVIISCEVLNVCLNAADSITGTTIIQ